jgi:hypothetical protein
VLTKSRVSFNPNPPKLPPRSTQFSLSIPTKRRVIQTSQDFTKILGSSRATPSHLGDWIPKSNKRNEVVEREGEVLWLEGGTLKEAWIFSQESRMKIEVLERERKGLKLWISNSILVFLSGQRPKGEYGGLFIAPTSKRSVGRFSTGQVWWGHWTSLVNPSGVRQKASRSRPLTEQVWWGPLETGREVLESGLRPD